MDRPPTNPTIRRLLAAASMDELLELRETAWASGHLALSRLAAQEIRRRTTSQLEKRLAPYTANRRMRRVP